MPMRIELNDLSDPRLDVFCRLTQRQLLQEQNGLFIAESRPVIRCALNAGYEPVGLLVPLSLSKGVNAPLIAEMERLCPVFLLQDKEAEKLTGYAVTRGVLCAMRRKKLPEIHEFLAGKRRIAVLENIVDPTNIGALMRSAACLGMDGVLLTPSCCDALHRRAVRVSMGTVFQVPWTRIGESSDDWPGNGLSILQSAGFLCAALSLTRNAMHITDERLHTADQLALVLGTEGDGLKKETIARCDMNVYIPMQNGADSLNVAAAGAVAFWELGNKERSNSCG